MKRLSNANEGIFLKVGKMTCQRKIACFASVMFSIVIAILVMGLMTGCVSTTQRIIDTTNAKRQVVTDSWALTLASDRVEKNLEQ